jgi:hypothetical protein
MGPGTGAGSTGDKVDEVMLPLEPENKVEMPLIAFQLLAVY